MAVIGIGTTSRVTVEDVLAVIDAAMAKLAERQVPPHPIPLPEGQGRIERLPLHTEEDSLSASSPLDGKGRMRGSSDQDKRCDRLELSMLAALDRPALNHVLAEAARQAHLDLLLLRLDRLQAVSHLCTTHSERSMKQYCIPSVAEAAALAGAGAEARLLLPRFCGRNITASVAA